MVLSQNKKNLLTAEFVFLFEVQTICAPKFMIREISGGNIPLSDCKSSSIFVWAGILKLHVYMPSEVKDVVSALCIISLVNGSLSSARISITAVLNSYILGRIFGKLKMK